MSKSYSQLLLDIESGEIISMVLIPYRREVLVEFINGDKKITIESKKIIIATYAMASEGLDIKSLTTVIFATPKTDITQATGRILRVKHARPLIIDIIDTHDVFKKQWNKRKLFYKRNKYKIDSISSTNYNLGIYKTIYDPENTSKSSTKPKCLIKLS